MLIKIKKVAFYCLFVFVLSTHLPTQTYSTYIQIVVIRTAEQSHTFILDSADTPEKRKKGLMHRQYLEENAGMFFLFDRPDQLCFWMKNTRVPLDILLINKQGTIVEILENMKPYSRKRCCSKALLQRAIELKGGICHDRGIRVGHTLTLVKKIRVST